MWSTLVHRFSPTAGYISTRYSASEIDALGVYCSDLDECFLVPIETFEGHGFLHLRLAPALNNQRVGCRMDAQYRLGAVAQMGERSAGSRKVRGSIPLSSMEA